MTQPTNIFASLQPAKAVDEVELHQYNNTLPTSNVLQNVINQTVVSSQMITSNPSTYAATRNQDIVDCLKGQGYDSVMIPDEMELTYINSIFQNKGFHLIDNITLDAVDNIGKQNFLDLNNKLKEFTKAMDGVKSAGILSIMSDLSKEVDEIDAEGVIERATNAKPTFLALFLGLFDKHAKSKSIAQKLDGMLTIINDKKGTVEGKLVNMEKNLRDQYSEQELNIKTMDKCYKAYEDTFKEMRRQFGLIVYLEHNFKSQFEQYKQSVADKTDVLIGTKIMEYERVLKNIENRRLLIQKTMSQLPLSATQCNTLINVCQNLMDEINTTLISSFPSIRGSLTSLGAVISARKAMLGNELASKLEADLALTATKAIGSLAVQTELVSANNRKREVETVQKIVEEMKANKQLIDSAKQQASQIIKDSGNLLTSLSEDIKLIASGQ